MNDKIVRLIEVFKCLGKWETRGLYAEIAKKTGFTPAYVGQVFKGVKKQPADKFIIAVCKAFGVDNEWILYGDVINDWSKKVADKFFEETGERAFPEDIESGNVKQQRPNFQKLLRLHDVLENTGYPDLGRVAELSNVTGFPEAETAGILTGAFHITEAFLQMVCVNLGINKEWIELSDDFQGDMGSYRNRTDAFARRDPRAGGDTVAQVKNTAPLDAPTQEIVNDMKRLTESNRWAFVGRVKPIIQAMIEEQGKGKTERPNRFFEKIKGNVELQKKID